MITRSAYIEKCPHGHGHCEIVFADGEHSERICSHEEAMDALAVALHDSRIDQHEYLELVRQFGEFNFSGSPSGPLEDLELVLKSVLSAITARK